MDREKGHLSRRRFFQKNWPVLAVCLLTGAPFQESRAEDAALSDDGDDADIVVSTGTASGIAQRAPGGGANNQPVLSAINRDEGGEVRQWAIPPIPWRGQIGLDADRFRFGDADWTGSSSARISVSASSYVLAPWFLSLSGGAAFSKSTSGRGGDSESINGNMQAGVLSMSRFAAALSASLAQTRTAGSSGTSRGGFKSLTWGQQYRPEDASFHSELNYTLSTFGQEGFGGGVTSQSMTGATAIQVEGDIPQTLSINAAATDTENDAAPEGSATQLLIANHSLYLEDYVMSITSDAGLNRSVVKGAGAGESVSLVVGSNMDWIPSDDYPLRLQGALRHFALRNYRDDGSVANVIDSTSANINAAYPINKNWSLAGAGFVIRSDDSLNQVTSYGVSTSLGWGGDGVTKSFDDWNYALSYRASTSGEYTGASSGSVGSDAAASATLGSGVGQSIQRTYSQPGDDAVASLTLSQGLDANVQVAEQGAQKNATLSHGASYAWTRAPLPDSSMGAILSARDGRSFGAGQTAYQEISGSVTGRQQVNARESFSWNLGAPLSRQSSSGSAGRWQGSVSGGFSYGNARFYNVTGLVYAASYNVGMQPAPEDGASISRGFVVRQMFAQSWAWKLGLLGWKLGNDISRDEDGKLTATVRLSVTRDFGGVL